MNGILKVIVCIGMLTGSSTAVSGITLVRKGVEIRVHVPYAEKLENESFYQVVVRIENRNKSPLILVTKKDEAIAAMAQFRSQSRMDAANQSLLELAPWNRVKQIADLTIQPGQAVEMIGGSAMGLSLPPDGESRLVFQVGPDEVVYSNWVSLRTLPAADTSNWPLVATLQVKPGEMGLDQLLIGTTPSGKWLFRRPVWNKNLLKRICFISGRGKFEIFSDTSRNQAEIIFASDNESKVYYNSRLDLARSIPWPIGNSGRDFINKPLPVDAPSPLEFPMELFADAKPNSLENSERDRNSSSRRIKSNEDSSFPPLGEDLQRTIVTEDSARKFVWIRVVGGCVLAGVLIRTIRSAK